MADVPLLESPRVVGWNRFQFNMSSPFTGHEDDILQRDVAQQMRTLINPWLERARHRIEEEYPEFFSQWQQSTGFSTEDRVSLLTLAVKHCLDLPTKPEDKQLNFWQYAYQAHKSGGDTVTNYTNLPVERARYAHAIYMAYPAEQYVQSVVEGSSISTAEGLLQSYFNRIERRADLILKQIKAIQDRDKHAETILFTHVQLFQDLLHCIASFEFLRSMDQQELQRWIDKYNKAVPSAK